MQAATFLVALLLAPGASAFAPAARPCRFVDRTIMRADALSRREMGAAALSSIGAAVVTLGSAGPASAGMFDGPDPNAPAKGFNRLTEVYGRSNTMKETRDPLLVIFDYPSLWLSRKPLEDTNGEAGTISAGDYMKGDSATFFVGKDSGGIDGKKKPFFKKVLLQAIQAKAANIENMNVAKITEGVRGAGGEQYALIDFDYDLVTGANFVVQRKGCASVTSLSDGSFPMVLAISTNARYKKIEGDLRVIASSFRVSKTVPASMLAD